MSGMMLASRWWGDPDYGSGGGNDELALWIIGIFLGVFLIGGIVGQIQEWRKPEETEEERLEAERKYEEDRRAFEELQRERDARVRR
jgi:hypothetical protein